jgi:hypothetical protein
MKIKLFFSAFLMSMFSTFAFSQAETSQTQKQENKLVEKTDHISWDIKSFDFGNIEQNKPAEAEFVFTNTSKQPITIAKVKSSCGCTITGYDKVPILPNQKSAITATYNAKKQGSFRKTLTVFLSDNSQYKLTIKGSVIGKETISMK